MSPTKKRARFRLPTLPPFMAFVIFIAAVIWQTTPAAGMTTPAVRAQSSPPFAEGQLIVRFRRDVPAMMVASAMLGARLQSLQSLPALDLELVAVEPGREIELIEKLRSNPLITYIGPNYIAHVAGEPNDSAWWRQWNMRQIKLPAAWDVTTGSNITIAILDTGVDLSHPDLSTKLVPGYDYVNNDDVPQDDFGHGTHVAGIAAAATNNGLGVAGVSWGARIMPLKVLDANGDGTYFNIIKAIQYAADQGARVINLSLGGSMHDPNLQAAIRYARNRGCLVVSAAGNQGGALLYPAAYSETLSVAATTDRQTRPSYSNYGAAMDVAAPGGTESLGIYSLAPGGGYAMMHGTSMAAPHVSGLAALIWSIAPTWSPEQVIQVIQATASKVGSDAYDGNGWNPFLGYGEINAEAAIKRVRDMTSPIVTPTVTRTPTPTFTPTRTPTPAQRTVEIPLEAGWNLVSFNVQPADRQIESLVASLRPALEVVLSFRCNAGGLSYYPDLPAGVSTLHTLEAGPAYWVKMKTAQIWRVSGEPIDPNARLALCPGWNLAGYLPNRELPVATALASLGDAYRAVLGYRTGQGISYYVDLPSHLNSLQRMAPGYGYWIWADRPAILTYPRD